jgi:hypothetical protein
MAGLKITSLLVHLEHENVVLDWNTEGDTASYENTGTRGIRGRVVLIEEANLTQIGIATALERLRSPGLSYLEIETFLIMLYAGLMRETYVGLLTIWLLLLNKKRARDRGLPLEEVPLPSFQCATRLTKKGIDADAAALEWLSLVLTALFEQAVGHHILDDEAEQRSGYLRDRVMALEKRNLQAPCPNPFLS